MARLIIWSRIIEHEPGRFLIVVSSSFEDRAASQAGTDVKTRDASSYHEAESFRDAMLRSVTADAVARGHEIAQIHAA